MRLFICEFITGGGLQDKELPDGLVGEGNMMLEAVLTDLLEMGIRDIITTRDDRLDALSLPVEQIAIKEDIHRTWQSCMNDVDAVLIIAPESEGVLFKLTLMAEQSECYLLGSSSISVQAASSKLKTAGDRKIYVAGGVRHEDDLHSLYDMGIDGVLIATALHTQQITADTLLKFTKKNAPQNGAFNNKTML